MMTDPLGDMLTRIRNAIIAKKDYVDVPKSKLKIAVLDTLKEEGYIKGYEILRGPSRKDVIRIYLKRVGKEYVIRHISRVSKPGRRLYTSCRKIPRVLSGLGILILSTSKGVMSDRKARKLGVGGEILAKVW